MGIHGFFKKRNIEKFETVGIEEVDFYPKEKIFYYNFTKDTCEKLRTGKCNIEEIFQYKDDLEEFEKRCDGFKCSNLALSLLKNGFVHHQGTGILIFKHSCGHYSCNNGQHRTCLAAKLDIPVKAELMELEDPCVACQYGHESL
ncbi:hypothetical protein [Anaeromicropila populeti]|uniref:Uncharacterized protein n=1 Tax=Anaeromicropila populeti TaxID=37658 RepID=A0A1I6JGX2_9FIRM|nr:hypothetical protein [Anaeromicropila populeti]SFR78104.1 hypothetical protein SAMN05661086_01668 [Anaeromicropila populeti]